MHDTPLLRETEDFLHAQIPITRTMGVAVEAYDENLLVLTAPLEANHNHLGTAFGGSLSAIATLAGYGLLWLKLGDRSAHIVIRDSKIRYHRPVRGMIRAVCQSPDHAGLSAFRAKFSEMGKAGISLRVTIEEEGRICVEFAGTYVAVR